MKVIISGGGTGGHIYPAVAIANELKTMDASIEILFVGAEGKMEMEKVPKAGYKILGLPIAGFNRSNMMANLAFPLKLIKSLWKARQIVKEFSPNAVVGVGGYASGPTLFAASLSGIPTLLQEQNSYAGVTNKLLAKKAKAICVAYPNMDTFFPQEKIVLTGNPVRKDISNNLLKQEDALAHFGLKPTKKTLLIIGGSQGARTINEAVLNGIKSLIDSDLQVIWQTGNGFVSKAKEATQNIEKDKLFISDFIYEMDYAYAAADVVVSRAGALSVSELCLAGKPIILVPFPNAAEDHQTKNAMSLVDAHAAILVKDINAVSDLIKETISLSQNHEKMKQLSINIRQFARPNAGKEIAEEVMKIMR